MRNIIEATKIQRQKEIENGENAITTNPIYVVYDIVTSICEPSDYSQSSSIFSYNDKQMWLSEYDNDVFEDVEDEDENDRRIQISYHDRFITFAFIRADALEYIEKDKHNLNNPKIFVHHIPNKNQEVLAILDMLGDND